MGEAGRIGRGQWAVALVLAALAFWRLAAAATWTGRVTVLAVGTIGVSAALLSVPGTTVVQAATLLIVLGGLLRPDLTLQAALLLVLAAPPAFLLSWELAGRPAQPEERAAAERRARWAVIGIILAAAGGSAFYRLLVVHRLEHTSALFIGVPTLLAILVVLSGTPSTATGAICKAIAIALLLSGIFLGEGFVCILMAAPLFFLVGVLIGLVLDATRFRLGRRAGTRMLCLVVLLLAPLSLEGVDARFTWSREERVTARRDVAAGPDAIAAALARPPRFQAPLPLFFRLGFPRPLGADGAGLAPGDRRAIHWSEAEGYPPGDLVLEVVESGPGRVRFRAIADDSLIPYWLTWQEAEVRWWATGAERSHVEWSFRYRRELDPAWYFGPWERYAVRLAAGYLIETLVAPGGFAR
jgi:hypothetical protein